MAVTISEDCIGCSACEGICPDVFEINDDGVATIVDGADFDEYADEIDEAIDACPVSAISKA